MTQASASNITGTTDSTRKQPVPAEQIPTLSDAISFHLNQETVSFHTPGHKGRPPFNCGASGQIALSRDVTELPGLDDMSQPSGAIARLERCAASVWGAADSIISVNGASAGLAAAMLALSARGDSVLVPRNAHRSVIHGLVLSGLTPLWYAPDWDADWQLWGAVSAASIERLIAGCHDRNLAGLVVVSPTYAGASSDTAALAGLCRKAGIALVIDAAHGAHLLPAPAESRAASGDIVVHSLHKTLPGLTQTGIVHISERSLVKPAALRSALRLVQTSSPSYLLLASVEQVIDFVSREEGRRSVANLASLRARIAERVVATANLRAYQPEGGTDPAHVLVGWRGQPPEALYDYLSSRGIYPEAVLGQGVLLMLGTGTTAADVERLEDALTFLGGRSGFPEPVEPASATAGSDPPPAPPQVLTPRQASLAPSETVPVDQAVGRIAAETVAPCPPGTAVVVAGQRVPQEVLEIASLRKLNVVIESSS